MARTPVRAASAVLLFAGAFLLGIRQGAKDGFPTPQLREWRLRTERLVEPDAMFVGDGPSFAAYDAGLDGKADIVMVGDSLIARGRWAELFPGLAIHDRGIGGDTVTGVLRRFDQVVAKDPRTVVIMVGLNDVVAGNRVADIVRVYEAIIAKVPKGRSVIVTSVLPCCSAEKRRRIGALNRALRQLASRRDATFIDLAAVVAPDGRVLPDYSIDGIHLTAAGYKRWRDALAPYIGLSATGRCAATNQDFAAPRTSKTC